MSAFLAALGLCSAAGTAMGLIAMLFSRTHSVGARALRAVYVLIALVLLVPWRPRIPVPAPVAERISVPMLLNADALRARLEGAPPVMRETIDMPARRIPSASQIAFGVWLAGAALSLVTAGARHARFLRLARRWRVVDDALEERLLAIDSQAVRAYRCDAVSAPMLAGLLRPTLYLPAGLSPDDDTLRHELAHLRARDLHLRAAWVLAKAAHWWNPFVYLLDRGCVFACEAAADARVCDHKSGEGRYRYARSVLDSAAARPLTPLTMYLGGGKQMMKQRLNLILRGCSGRFGALMLALALLVGLCAPLTRAESATVVTFGTNTLSGTRLDPVVNGLHMGASLDELVTLADARAWELWQDGANIYAMATDAREHGWYTFESGILSVQLNVLYPSEAEAREAAQALVNALEPLYGPYDKIMLNPFNARWEEESASSCVRIRPNADKMPSEMWFVTFEYTSIPAKRQDDNNAIAFDSFHQLYPSINAEDTVFIVDEESLALLREVLDSLLAQYGVSGDAPEGDAQAAFADIHEKGCVEALTAAAGENSERFWLQVASLECIPTAAKLLEEEPGTARAAVVREFFAEMYFDLFGELPEDLDGWLAGEVEIISDYYGK